MDDALPTRPILALDRKRTLRLGWRGWRSLERHYGSFLNTWTVLYRLTKSSAAVMYLRSVVGESQADVIRAAADIMNQAGPVMDDVAMVIWASCMEEAEKRQETLTVPQVEDHLNPACMAEYLNKLRIVVEQMSPPPSPQ